MTQAEIARALMIYTWDGYDPNEINGRINPRDFDDACKVCHTMGAISRDVTGGSNGSTNREYLFPDGSVTVIVVDDDGIGVGIEDILP